MAAATSTAAERDRPPTRQNTSELHGPVLARIRSVQPSLSRTGARIAAAVLHDPRGIVEMTVTDLAEGTATSVASVVRLCQDLGLRGYQDLKLRLASETATEAAPLPEPDDSPLTTTLAAAARAVNRAIDTLDLTTFTSLVDVIANASRVLVVGVGTSAPIAQDAAYRLRTHAIPVDAPTDNHVQHIAARLLGPGTACLAISHTGQTHETLTAVRAARETGATTLAITSFHRSPLTDLCDHAVVAGGGETGPALEAGPSRLVHLAVIDAALAALTQKTPERTEAAQSAALDAVTDHRI